MVELILKLSIFVSVWTEAVNVDFDERKSAELKTKQGKGKKLYLNHIRSISEKQNIWKKKVIFL